MHLLRGLSLIVVMSLATGCARPYRGPKTLAAVAVALLVGGSTAWVAGERNDDKHLSQTGRAITAVGAAAAVAAGGWLAGSAACRVDPDCPEDETCREVPAPPGREPYRQCVPR